MNNKEIAIRENSKFLLHTTGPSKKINEMNANELKLLSIKASAMKIFSENFDYRDGLEYWGTVEKVSQERLKQIETK